MRIKILAATTVIAALALTGCGPTDKPSAKPSTVASVSAPSAIEAFTKLAIPTTSLGTVVTAANDENHLIGLPGQYTSKITFTDSRLDGTDAKHFPADDVNRGGSIEAFATAADAKKRADYISKVAVGMFAEQDILTGTVLLRLSRYLTPAQAAEYSSAAAHF